MKQAYVPHMQAAAPDRHEKTILDRWLGGDDLSFRRLPEIGQRRMFCHLQGLPNPIERKSDAPQIRQPDHTSRWSQS